MTDKEQNWSAPVRCRFREKMGWRKFQLDGCVVWFAGYLYHDGGTLTDLSAAELLRRLSAAEIKAQLPRWDGHFAFARIGEDGKVFAAVDCIASRPLFVAKTEQGPILGNHGMDLAGAAGLGGLDGEASLSVALAGYTTGRRTLVRGLEPLQPGEYLMGDAASMTVGRYYTFRPLPAEGGTQWQSELADRLRQMFDRLVQGLDQRPVALPLSAGLDSRLILTGLWQAGHRDIHCFSYGQPGNFEARTSQELAARLGLRWTFVPFTHRSQRAMRASARHRAYLDDADSLMAVPFEQDLPALTRLKDSKWLPDGAVVINGQSGDFITGNHIPPRLAAGGGADYAAAFEYLVQKHYGLWTSLQVPERLGVLKELVRRDLLDQGTDPDQAPAATVFEQSEYYNRQSKYVVGGQAVYDHLGMDWRLPLWDADFVRFWEGVPTQLKIGQKLYRQVLTELDWCGLWTIAPPKRNVRPLWAIPARSLGKLACAPFGREAWRQTDRRVFHYWIDVLANMAPIPYWTVVKDRRGFRNSISWLTEIYLRRHGMDWTGTWREESRTI